MSESTAGFCWCANDTLRNELQPLVPSFPAKDLTEENRLGHNAYYGGTQHQAAIEFCGSRDRAAEMVLPDAIAFFNELGFDRINARMRELGAFLLKQLDVEECPPLRVPDAQRQWAMTSFRFPPCDRAAFRRWMLDHHQCCLVVARNREDVDSLPDRDIPPRQQRYFLRISTAWWNTEEEIIRGIHALKDVLTRRPKEALYA
jgi:isopenicillin-N epimerase